MFLTKNISIVSNKISIISNYNFVTIKNIMLNKVLYFNFIGHWSPTILYNLIHTYTDNVIQSLSFLSYYILIYIYICNLIVYIYNKIAYIYVY